MSEGKRILVTGAGGFVGRALLAACRAAGQQTVAVLRPGSSVIETGQVHRQDLAATASLPETLLAGVDTLYHLAALAHHRVSDEAMLQRLNVDLPLALARQAAAAGVRRFVFLSSVGAQAQASRTPLTEAMACTPTTAYGRSKRAAETGLAGVAAETGLSVTMLRPPLVVGPDAPGNLARLAAWAARGRPLPRAALDNRRSLVTLPELVSALMLAAEHPAADGKTFLVANPEPLSTGGLYRLLAAAAGREARFVRVPAAPLAALLRLGGRRAMADGLFADLTIDPAAISRTLGWRPVEPIAEAIATALGSRLSG